MITFLIIFLLFYHPITSSAIPIDPVQSIDSVFSNEQVHSVDPAYSIDPLQLPGSMNRLMTQHITLQCDFTISPTGHICTARNLNITSHNVTLIRVSSDHQIGVRNDGVANLIISRQNMFYIPEGMSNFFRNLEIVTVFKSNLRVLRFTDFIGLYGLRRIFINENNIQTIHEDTFKAVPHLQVLDLSNNRIKSIPFVAFSLAIELKILTLSNNLIRIFDILPFPVDSQLEELRLNGNQLVRFNLASISRSEKLESVDLRENFCINLCYPIDTRNVVHFYTEIVENCNDDRGMVEWASSSDESVGF